MLPIDYFEHYDKLPHNIQAILNAYNIEAMDYDMCGQLLRSLNAEGWTFDYGLDATPYNLRKF